MKRKRSCFWLVGVLFAILNVYVAFRAAEVARALDLPFFGSLYDGPQMLVGVLLADAAALLLLSLK